MPGIFGGSKKPSAPKASASPAATSSAPAGVAPGTSPDDYRRQQIAQYQQMLSGLGLAPTGELPQGIQENIDRQAALIK